MGEGPLRWSTNAGSATQSRHALPELDTQPSQPESQPSSASPERPVVFGEVLFDHFPDGSRVLGGAPFNVAWHLRGLGVDPLMVSAVGDDDEGVEVRRRMEVWGMSSGGVQVDPARPTGRVTATIEEGSPRFDIGADQAWDAIGAVPACEAAAGSPVPLLYHGTLALRSAASASALQALIHSTDAQTFVDLNLRAPWWTRERVLLPLAHASWVKLNDEELGVLTSRPVGALQECEDAAVAFAREYSISRVVVTRGERGAIAVIEARDVLETDAPAVTDVVDTVGAGDAFSAIMCVGILRGWGVEETLDRAASFAAELCRVRGATIADRSLYDAHVQAWAGEPSQPPQTAGSGLYVMSLSLHGLLRARDIELGRDADTGGQISYVVDQARALAAHPDIERVDLVTRQVFDRRVDESYSRPVEPIENGARIVRIPFGPKRYLRKESLWPHLDSAMDQLTRYIRAQRRVPDVIHGHYADCGYVGAQLSKLLGVPFVYTGHSLGRVKRSHLLVDGRDPDSLEGRYHFLRRIEAEERALETAALVIASTNQEVHEQYERYDHYQPDRMEVIPPGVDVTRFAPPAARWQAPPIASTLARFLREPDKPMLLALARPDERKNFDGLIRAFAETTGLREIANLVLVAGNRGDPDTMPTAAKRVVGRIIGLIDEYDLYGSVAYPKSHEPTDIPDLFRLAARSRGVFVNPALTEPFGLTLIEAAASGLPIVATNDGGPRDILAACENGVLVNPLDTQEMGRAIVDAITDGDRWSRWAKSGVEGAHQSFTWNSHAARYTQEVRVVLKGQRPPGSVDFTGSRLGLIDRVLITDVDDTLTGDDKALALLLRKLEEAGPHVGFGLATGRSLNSAMDAIIGLGIPTPDVLITASGAELHYGKHLTRDRSWEHQIQYRWDPVAVHGELVQLPGLTRGEDDEDAAYRLRYVIDPKEAPGIAQIRRALRKAGLQVTLILDRRRNLDVLPVRASPGTAMRFLLFKWNLPPERLLVAGDSGNDAGMLSGDTLGVVVNNHAPELDRLRGQHRVYFAERDNAWGILEGIEWYDFFGGIRVPEESEPLSATSARA